MNTKINPEKRDVEMFAIDKYKRSITSRQSYSASKATYPSIPIPKIPTMGARRRCSAAAHRPSSSFPTWAQVWVLAWGALASRASHGQHSAV